MPEVNRLAGEVSPYLRQHADNPVDWYPWGQDAFDLARREDKPLFVSIGYASCHWCHVMAHESFEDEATADDLGRWFVSIKVDREERPDVDAVYMAAVQAVTGSGGWPMSVFCTPDGRPFLGGTYFPPTDRHGLPGFRRLLAAVAEAWRDRRGDVEQQADALVEAIARDIRLVDRLAAGHATPEGATGAEAGTAGGSGQGQGQGQGQGRQAAGRATGGARGAPSVPPLAATLEHVVDGLRRRFDHEWGGFGPAPKFPRPTLVELCLRHHQGSGDPSSLAMATTTLDAMAAGGIYDHLAGGFARYSTDHRWRVPHFEKMLTDQALLARAYLHAWQVTGEATYRQVATETLDYALTDLAAASGALCSSEDADAGGVEGGHATFTPDQVRTALEEAGRADLTTVALDWYGVTATGNFEGTNVLFRPPGAPLERPPEVEVARQILLASRRRRRQPARDEKVLTEWNAMTIAVLAEAAGALDVPRWAERAEAIAESLFAGSRRPDGRWLRASGGPVMAFAADYAWLVESCTRLGELTGRAAWTQRAEAIAGELLDLFWDGDRGGLFTTGRDAEQLVVRGKDFLDGAVPSASSVAAQALLRLASLTGSDRLRTAGEQLVDLAAPLLEQQPDAVADMVAAIAWLDGGGAEVVVSGDRPDLLAVVRERWLPAAVLAWGERTASPLWSGRDRDAAYVCRQFTCQSPAGDPGTLRGQLAGL